MVDKSRSCSACGSAMALRLGQFECSGCGLMEAATPAAALPDKRSASGAASSGARDAAAQYRQDAAAEGISAQNDTRVYSAPPRGAARAGGGMSRKQLMAAQLILIGGLGFVLPLTGVQFIVLQLFGRFEYVAAGAMVVLGVIVLAAPET